MSLCLDISLHVFITTACCENYTVQNTGGENLAKQKPFINISLPNYETVDLLKFYPTRILHYIATIIYYIIQTTNLTDF